MKTRLGLRGIAQYFFQLSPNEYFIWRWVFPIRDTPVSMAADELARRKSAGQSPAMVRFPFSLTLITLVVCLLAGCATSSETFRAGETQRGMASWYGAEQNGGLTASGEHFNMHKLTAAHRHFPFGTLVRVTNEQNGKSVDVRINDRGPWTGDDRIIDVSSAAADDLEMKKSGIVPVELEILELGSGKCTGSD
jgi:Lytic transglycolase